MEKKIKVFDIAIDDYSAKQAMKETVDYLASEPLNTVELVTVDTLMYAREGQEIKEYIETFDMVLAGEKDILRAADITDRRRLREVESKTYLKMALRYFHKNHLRVYLLVEAEEAAESIFAYLSSFYGGIQIAGIAKLSSKDRADDMVVNAVNGGEVDCILAAVSTPVQEEFCAGNRKLLNARLWLGAGKALSSLYRKRRGKGRFTDFFLRHIFKREIEKNKK